MKLKRPSKTEASLADLTTLPAIPAEYTLVLPMSKRASLSRLCSKEGITCHCSASADGQTMTVYRLS